MSDCRKIPVMMFILVVCVAGSGSAEHDMSLPDLSHKVRKSPPVVAVRDQTPPLINAFAAPDGAMRGLAYDGQYLWAANSGDGNSIYGSKIYRLDPDSGTVLSTFHGPSDYSCGLAWDGEFLWYSAYITGMIMQVDTSAMIVIKAFNAPTSHPFDLAWDGTYLYAVRGNEAYISIIDTSNGQEIDSIAATYSSPNVRPFGLTFLPRNAPQLLTSDGNYGSNLVNTWNFYADAWVDQWPAEPASYPSGLAHDSVTERLWVSCYERDSIYVYDVSQVGIFSYDPVVAELSGIEVHPNPFNHSTDIRYQMIGNSQVPTLRIYDISGRLVTDLSGRCSAIGHQISAKWDGTDEDGRMLPQGVYFVTTPMRNGVVKLVKSSR